VIKFRKVLQGIAGQAARDLVGVAFDAAEDALHKRRGQCDPDAPEILVQMPEGARLSSLPCPRCDGSFFFLNDPRGECDQTPIRYWCPDPECRHTERCSPREAVKR
jgi:hypothetical protein